MTWHPIPLNLLIQYMTNILFSFYQCILQFSTHAVWRLCEFNYTDSTPVYIKQSHLSFSVCPSAPSKYSVAAIERVEFSLMDLTALQKNTIERGREGRRAGGQGAWVKEDEKHIFLNILHKIENFFGSEFEFYTISLLVMLKY